MTDKKLSEPRKIVQIAFDSEGEFVDGTGSNESDLWILDSHGDVWISGARECRKAVGLMENMKRAWKAEDEKAE